MTLLNLGNLSINFFINIVLIKKNIRKEFKCWTAVQNHDRTFYTARILGSKERAFSMPSPKNKMHESTGTFS